MQRRIVLTGVSRGCGLALARFFNEAGHLVWGCGRSPRPATLPAGVHYERLDVRDAESVAAWAKACEKEGVPDLVVNNAAIINRSAPLWKLNPDEIASVLDVNIKGVANVIWAFAPALIRAGAGVLVNFSSGWGRSTSPEVAPYCAAKWGVEGLSRAVAQELPDGVFCVALNPGIIDTEMLRSCFGSSAAAYPTPEQWARVAGPFILSLGKKDNGRSVDLPV